VAIRIVKGGEGSDGQSGIEIKESFWEEKLLWIGVEEGGRETKTAAMKVSRLKKVDALG